MSATKVFYIIAGGTFVDIAPHFALAAPALGRTGVALSRLLPEAMIAAGRINVKTQLILTSMAQGVHERAADERRLFTEAGIRDLRTNQDLDQLLTHLVKREDTTGIILAAAVCDFEPAELMPAYTNDGASFGRKTHPRLSSHSALTHTLLLKPSDKLVRRIRATRKDLFLVGFKTTVGETPDAQYFKGLDLVKKASCNLVVANDLTTGLNMVITPEQARYHETTDRLAMLKGLAEMVALRSNLHFTRVEVVPGDAIPWSSELVPASLRAVVDHCCARGAYKPFLGSTVGHFAVKVDDQTILTSRRKTNFNHLDETGLVMLKNLGPDRMLAYGSKPSVGGQSQRIVFSEHPDVDCIVHFHCPIKPDSPVAVRSQRPYECGSHECGANTSAGLMRFDNIRAVMLDKHGPNIVFHRDTDPAKVIRFIEDNFDLEGRTDNVRDAA